MAHLGLTPQSIYKFGTYNVRAKKEEEADKLRRRCKIVAGGGMFCVGA